MKKKTKAHNPTTTSAGAERFGLGTVAGAALRLLPSSGTALKGLAGLSRVWPDSRRSLGALIEQQAAARPDKECLRFEGQRWTYRDFNAWANRVADVLRTHGIGQGDCVGLLFENRPDLLACVAGAAKLGAIAGMLNPNQRGEVLRHSIDVIRPRLLIVDADCLPALRSAFAEPTPDCLWLWVGEGAVPAGLLSLPQLAQHASIANPTTTRQVRARDACYYIFTSGTTGLPKASIMTHLRWLRSGYGMGRMAMRLTPDDIFYCPLPFYHNNALTLSWSAVLTTGATLAMARKFSASKFWNDIRSVDATAFVYIGELCRYLLAQTPRADDTAHRVRVIVGNGLRAEIWDEFQKRFGIDHICEFYGSSEGNLAFVNAFGLARTAGFTPMAHAIVDFDTSTDTPVRNARDRLQRVAEGATGLLISEVTRSSPFDGYTDADATEAKLLRNVFKEGDVWLNSGDLVRAQGMRHVAFVDRVGDTFRWKGENVATTEVERAVAALPGIDQASVYGVQVPHADGRAGMAAIVLHNDAAFDGAAAARMWLQTLPAYAVPVFVRLIAAHELTATFKIRKTELKVQGCDPAQTRDPMFILRDRARGYEPLTEALWRDIVAGKLRL